MVNRVVVCGVPNIASLQYEFVIYIAKIFFQILLLFPPAIQAQPSASETQAITGPAD